MHQQEFKSSFFGFVLILAMSMSSCLDENSNYVISLDGEWLVTLDPEIDGFDNVDADYPVKQKSINLPGTLDELQIGKPHDLTPELNNYVLSSLARKHAYIGLAQYEKTIKIPSSWKGQRITMELERIIWKSTVMVDGQEVGSNNSLVGPHRYDLTNVLTPGKHTLAVVIDNSNQFPEINVEGSRYPDPEDKDMAHAYTNHTQIKWNGILGKMELRATAGNPLENLQVYPDPANRKLTFTYQQKGADNKQPLLTIRDKNNSILYQDTILNPRLQGDAVSFVIPSPQGISLWDEFNPEIYTAVLRDGLDSNITNFGYRSISQDKGKLLLNEKPIFLRGNLECSIFPLTGHPPMNTAAWKELFQTAKSYGLNHFRFHSWCPPKAAFTAADEVGFYLQAELPHWSLKYGEDQPTVDFLDEEAKRIHDEYGNHPSFILFSMGNELQGDMALLNEKTNVLKSKDNRRLYTTTSFSFQKPAGLRPEPADEFFITQYTEKGWIRGQGVFNQEKPSFSKDYTENSAYISIPLISHEIGQYSVYPDLSEIGKYTGVLDPVNFKAVKKDLAEKALLPLADKYTLASGKLATLLYKEEIERALKTESFDGFQLLQLQDFPGQGTALVGLLNAFWESKGAVNAEEFRSYCSEVVPLARFDRATYESGDVFTANVEIANYYKEVENQIITWSLKNNGEIVIAEGQWKKDLQLGINGNIGTIQEKLATDQAIALTLEVSLAGTPYRNAWTIWVYPKSTINETNRDIVFTSLIDEALDALSKGKKVLLNPAVEELAGVTGRFVPVFWSPVHFPDQPGTMGLLIEDDHPALHAFPTSFHTDWQWWDLVKKSKAVILPKQNLKPIVRVIDNFVNNRNLANIFEAKVGNGKLLVCAMDITNDLNNRPAARQLRNSLLKYLESEDFDPENSIAPTDVKALSE